MKTFQFYHQKSKEFADKYNSCETKEAKELVQKEIDDFIASDEEFKNPVALMGFNSLLDILIPDRGLEHPVFGK